MTAAPENCVFALPDLGEGLTEAEILVWRVAVGSTVEVDQVVVEVETVKATVEVPVPYAGTVLELHADAGTVLAVGAPLISVRRVAPASIIKEQPSARDGHGEQLPADSGPVLVGFGTNHFPANYYRRINSTAAPSGPAGDVAPHPAEQHNGATPAAAPLVISPLVRLLAHQHGIDVNKLSPSGPHGVVLRRDVELAIARTTPPAAAATPLAQAPDAVEHVPLRGSLRTAAEKLSRSSKVPCATTWVDVDATDLLHTREVLRASEPGRRIGLMAILARICVAGLRRFPELNSTVDLEQAQIVRFSAINLGFAAQTKNGLVVPVVHDAHRMTIAKLAAEIDHLTNQAHAGDLQPKTLVGSTFTLNNYGVFGVDGSAPLINYPEAAMIGVSHITDKPWVVEGQLAVRKVTQLSLTFDHRVCDGGTAARFLRYIADRVERPAILLADL